MVSDNEKNPVLGIDLGTTFSSVARWDGRGPRVYENKEGDFCTQSVVYYDEKEGSYLVGRQAYGKYLADPDRGILGVKRLMDDRNHEIVLGSKVHNPIDISSKILSKLYMDVCDKFPKGSFEARGVVVTVPYYFKAHQCANTREAAEAAQLNFVGIIQEPIAAALAYSLNMIMSSENSDRDEIVLVFDLGGGTFDLTIFRLKQTSDKLLFEVLGTGGDDRLGGLDFDQCLKDYIIASNKIDLDSLDEKLRKLAVRKLMEGSKEAKEGVSFQPGYNLVIPFLTGSVHLDIDITRKEFEQCIEKYIEEVRSIIEDTLSKSNVRKNDITRVIKVGGSSKIPIFSEMLQEGIGQDRVYGNIDPSLCVAQGAAIYAAYLDDKDVLGREVEIITRNCHALGIETADGGFFPLVANNRRLPYSCSQIFTTDKDNMTELEVEVYQGSSRAAKENTLIGKIRVPGLVPKPRETLNIKITFKVNEEQHVTVVVEEPISKIKIAETLRYDSTPQKTMLPTDNSEEP
jgi:molecular chaperone DnaK (HSP70)